MRNNSDPRRRRPEEISNYASGWDNIFGKKAPQEDPPKEPQED